MELELAIAVLALATKAAPIIEAKIKSGDVTPEEQEKARTAYLAYRAAVDAAFTGLEWRVES